MRDGDLAAAPLNCMRFEDRTRRAAVPGALGGSLTLNLLVKGRMEETRGHVQGGCYEGLCREAARGTRRCSSGCDAMVADAAVQILKAANTDEAKGYITEIESA